MACQQTLASAAFSCQSEPGYILAALFNWRVAMNKRLMDSVVRGGCALLLLGMSVAVHAQYYGSPERAGRWEGSLGMRYQDFGSFDFGPTRLDVDDGIGFGFSAAYNFDDHWSLGFELSGGDANYDATGQSSDTPSTSFGLSGDLDTSTGQLIGTWHMLKGAFTPFISAGIGWTYIDSNIISEYQGSSCWWDPWWGGYNCASYYDTYDDTVLSWSASVGLRWEITPRVFLRGSIGQNWLDLSRAGTIATDIGRLEVGMMF